VTAKFIPEALFEHGFTQLVSVIPPGAQLLPSSKIVPATVGKVPGRRVANGLWAGYDWRSHEATLDDVRQWCVDGASVGLRADRFPAIDIDCTDENISRTIASIVRAKLGAAPERVGRAPKTLFLFRLADGDEPFGRMRLWFEHRGQKHLIEILGQGQQYLVHGTHPTTMRPYSWNCRLEQLAAASLPPLSRAAATEILDELQDHLGLIVTGKLEREGTGKPLAQRVLDQAGLLAPSIEVVRAAVAVIPNTSSLFPGRDDYLRMGYAIRAAGGDEYEDEAYGIFAEWASRWSDGTNEPDTVRADWRRFKAPYSVGWSWLCEQARPFGFNDAALEFDAVESVSAAPILEAPRWSEQWLAERVAAALRGKVRYVPQKGTFLAWEGARWRLDAELQTEDLIKHELRVLADRALREAATEKDKKEALQRAESICSAKKAASVTTFIRSDRAVAVTLEALDHDPWALNTPGGIVNLKTGELTPTNPDALTTKTTAVPPDFAGACPEWKRFLAEATGGDRELEAFLKRYAGYCLTGSTREQNVVFIFGPGGNGKSVFVNALEGILGDYAQRATMDTFTTSYGDKHTTDVASLVGARLVSASETAAGKRWDETRVKGLSGGEPVTARFMRQDNFTFIPQCKLCFVGNHRPSMTDIDDAWRRRIQIVPFTVTPARVDTELGAKLREEWPAILAWMIDGCREWQELGLKPPAIVRASTDDYFDTEDDVGGWMRECLERDDEATATSQALYDSYREWANRNGVFVMKQKSLSSALVARRLERWKEPGTRRAGFRGVRVNDRMGAEFNP
jgi:P4 family phage/plasmid primase-like protien